MQIVMVKLNNCHKNRAQEWPINEPKYSTTCGVRVVTIIYNSMGG